MGAPGAKKLQGELAPATTLDVDLGIVEQYENRKNDEKSILEAIRVRYQADVLRDSNPHHYLNLASFKKR